MKIIGQLQVNHGDIRFIHVGFVTLRGGLSMIGFYWSISQWKITRFALSNHLFPSKESGTPWFLSLLNLLLYFWKYREIPQSVPEYFVDSGKQDAWSLFVFRLRLTDRLLYFLTYSANIFYSYMLHTILGRTQYFLRKINCLRRRKWGSTM